LCLLKTITQTHEKAPILIGVKTFTNNLEKEPMTYQKMSNINEKIVEEDGHPKVNVNRIENNARVRTEKVGVEHNQNSR
jgi:hypothetical protein